MIVLGLPKSFFAVHRQHMHIFPIARNSILTNSVATRIEELQFATIYMGSYTSLLCFSICTIAAEITYLSEEKIDLLHESLSLLHPPNYTPTMPILLQ